MAAAVELRLGCRDPAVPEVTRAQVNQGTTLHLLNLFLARLPPRSPLRTCSSSSSSSSSFFSPYFSSCSASSSSFLAVSCSVYENWHRNYHCGPGSVPLFIILNKVSGNRALLSPSSSLNVSGLQTLRAALNVTHPPTALLIPAKTPSPPPPPSGSLDPCSEMPCLLTITIF
ncbi:hypothetical protein E2C01_045223 [Portunus trituberculatus]|uniref:Uncharacterized protein n=1 Tax=Portunus trituberculatus TaxID=210409 RepID=A0A5B7G1I0_PORTR|nr:hypothetical protein [Portunus trituberculatus]